MARIGGNDRPNILRGTAGTDQIFGLGGPDTLIGRPGNDLLTGGSGRDVFMFNKGYDGDTIRDFENGRDTIDLNGFGLRNWEGVRGTMSQVGRDVVMRFGDGDVLKILDTALRELDRDDFF